MSTMDVVELVCWAFAASVVFGAIQAYVRTVILKE